MNTVCKLNQCKGCMSCVDICPKNAIKIIDDLCTNNAIIDNEKCIDCMACRNVCQVNNPLIPQEPQKWVQGWSNDKKIRETAPSGGIATSIEKAFIENGGSVCSCKFENGEFSFLLTNDIKDLKKFSGSKYVKSSPLSIHKEIRSKLKSGEKILFVGLPCQSAGVQKFVGDKLAKKLYTIDLICHGTPSPKLLDIFLKQYDCDLKTINKISFRNNTSYKISIDGNCIGNKNELDRYSMAFLHSLSMTENCYNCPYARKERVSDITLGDSWGSLLPSEVRKAGISLILCQSEKGNELLQAADIHTEYVDSEIAAANNQPLTHSLSRPSKREKFFSLIDSGKSFNSSVLKCYPKLCVKQKIKKCLIKLKLINK